MQETDGSASMMEVDEAEPAAPEVPRKLVQSLHNVQVNAKVTSYDYDGLADSQSLVRTLSAIDPRQLILIHGSPKVGLLQPCVHVFIARLNCYNCCHMCKTIKHVCHPACQPPLVI